MTVQREHVPVHATVYSTSYRYTHIHNYDGTHYYGVLCCIVTTISTLKEVILCNSFV